LQLAVVHRHGKLFSVLASLAFPRRVASQMNNEIPENENSPEIIEVDLPPAIKTPVPALEPFEVMYKHGNEKPIIDTLVPPPNPIM
jgi:hypothetical protein